MQQPYPVFLSTKWNDKLLIMQLLLCFTKWGYKIKECVTDILKGTQTEKRFGFFPWMKDLKPVQPPTPARPRAPPLATMTLPLLTWFHQPLQPRWELWSERSSVLRWGHQCSARHSLSSSPAQADTHTRFTCKPKQRLAQSHETANSGTSSLFGYFSVLQKRKDEK